MPEHVPYEIQLPFTETDESPLHGYRGEQETGPGAGGPAGLTIAISREAGSRGADIAKRAGQKLGWEVYTQDVLDFVAENPLARKELLDKLPTAATPWIEHELQRLQQEEKLSGNPAIVDLTRLMLTLGSLGNVILLGRGAGFILPPPTTLHVRLIAPLADRIAYMSQWQRLTDEEAAEQVSKRDRSRAEFVATHFHRQPNDLHAFDMVLNTSLLGEECCVDLIAAAARAKMSASIGYAAAHGEG